jgi:hypothetical protein
LASSMLIVLTTIPPFIGHIVMLRRKRRAAE